MIQQLCVVAGMLMEDVSSDAISSPSSGPRQRRKKLAELRQAGADISALVAAAEVLDRRGSEYAANSD